MVLVLQDVLLQLGEQFAFVVDPVLQLLVLVQRLLVRLRLNLLVLKDDLLTGELVLLDVFPCVLLCRLRLRPHKFLSLGRDWNLLLVYFLGTRDMCM